MTEPVVGRHPHQRHINLCRSAASYSVASSQDPPLIIEVASGCPAINFSFRRVRDDATTFYINTTPQSSIDARDRVWARLDRNYSSGLIMLVTERNLEQLSDALGFGVKHACYKRTRRKLQKALEPYDLHSLKQGRPVPCWKSNSGEAITLAQNICKEVGRQLWPDDVQRRWPSWAKEKSRYDSIFDI